MPDEPLTILIAEDEKASVFLYTEVLIEAGYRTVTAENGYQALGMLEDEPVADDGDARAVGQHAAQHTAVWTRPDDAILRAAQLGRRDHLHGLGDLPRVFHAADATP